MIAVCSGIKRDGSRCTATVEPPQEYCWWHDPANSDKRRQAASKGGGGKEIRDLKRRISEVIDDVLEGSQERGGQPSPYRVSTPSGARWSWRGRSGNWTS